MPYGIQACLAFQRICIGFLRGACENKQHSSVSIPSPVVYVNSGRLISLGYVRASVCRSIDLSSCR